jgi:ATP-dependent helicase STH1/SNF2
MLFQRKSGGVKGLSGNEMMQLRMICQPLFLFESVEDNLKISPDGSVDDKLVRTSGKVEPLCRSLPNFLLRGTE